MIRFKSFASSSKGNCYLVEADGANPLLIDAGIPIKIIREKLRDHGLSISDLAGCLVDHEHQDHAKAVKDLLKVGVDCYMSKGTAEALGVISHHRIHVFTLNTLGMSHLTGHNEEHIIAFRLEHDAREPVGFFIAYGDDRLLFIPDTAYVENRFQGITMIAIECNMIAELLNKNIQEGNLPAIVGKRVRRNHMSLENLIMMLRANDLSKCRTIFLMHLSDGNSDEQRMIQEVQQATGIPTEAC